MDVVGESLVHGMSGDRQRRALLAAMSGIYAAVENPVAHLPALPASARPMPAQEAVRTIDRAEGPLRDRAVRLCGARLAVGAFVDRRGDLYQCLIDLTGVENTNAIAASLGNINDPSRALVMTRAYQVLATLMPVHHASEPADQHTTSNLDIRTMTTTVGVTTSGTGDFQRLAEWMDPRSWRASPFWLASYKAIKVGNRFVPDPDQPPIGRSWKGYFYEYVQWAHNESVVSAFQCYLDVAYGVDFERRRIDLGFSLYTCAGSMLLERIAVGGVEVDSGRSAATPLDDAGCFRISALKRIRYSDLVTRSTPNQGGDGAGQTLNYMAPAVVALWMDDLVYESTLSWSRGERAPGTG